VLKRTFDILASFIGLILLIPVLLILVVIIKIGMPGPILFKQIRAGRHGKSFSICKFRTMTLDHRGTTISVKGENRITPLGAILRKYKLDELPELWNIFVGEMSFVGPRPDIPEYANKLTGEERQILELRPGLTGPATLKYVNEEELLVNIPDKVRINLDYYYNRSLGVDILIIFKTIFGKRS
jgi:lipopolysaccharide/colanic/teichoic acid biosynthesis glycosyltransferase